MKVKIVAFLQNPWFPAGTKPDHISLYRTDQEFHQKLLRQTMTGNRLVMSFGDELFKRIWWDNAAPSAVDHPRKRSPINMIHVESVINTQSPDLIIAFGELAKEAIDLSVEAMRKKVMYCHHPNARFKTQSDLDAFAQEVMDYVSLHDRYDEFTKHDVDVAPPQEPLPTVTKRKKRK